MGVGAAVVSADWVALVSLWEAPTNVYSFFKSRTPKENRNVFQMQ
jgi:hypothetical protein